VPKPPPEIYYSDEEEEEAPQQPFIRKKQLPQPLRTPPTTIHKTKARKIQ